MAISNPSVSQIKRALQVAEQIEILQAELSDLLGSSSLSSRTFVELVEAVDPFAIVSEDTSDAPVKKRGRGKGKRTLSPEARLKIAAAQKRRWAKSHAGAASSSAAPSKKKTATKGKRNLSPEAREKISAAQKKRWAKFASDNN